MVVKLTKGREIHVFSCLFITVVSSYRVFNCVINSLLWE